MPVAAALGVAVFAVHGVLSWTPTSATLLADGGQGGPGTDSDGDGLPDKVESQFGSGEVGGPDVDGDGFPDLMEVILGSQPSNRFSTPTPADIAQPKTRVLAFIENGQFHLKFTIYLPNGDPSSINSIGGMLVVPDFYGLGGGLNIPLYLDLNSVILGGSVALDNVPGGSGVVSSDCWLPLNTLGLLSAQGAPQIQFTVAFAAWVGGVKISDVEFFTSTSGSDPNSLAQVQILPGGGIGSFRPLEPVAPPTGWESNSSCVLSFTVVGVEPGAIVIFETSSAGCQPFSGTICDPAACMAEGGKLIKTLDPTSLGG